MLLCNFSFKNERLSVCDNVLCRSFATHSPCQRQLSKVRKNNCFLLSFTDKAFFKIHFIDDRSSRGGAVSLGRRIGLLPPTLSHGSSTRPPTDPVLRLVVVLHGPGCCSSGALGRGITWELQGGRSLGSQARASGVDFLLPYLLAMCSCTRF